MADENNKTETSNGKTETSEGESSTINKAKNLNNFDRLDMAKVQSMLSDKEASINENTKQLFGELLSELERRTNVSEQQQNKEHPQITKAKEYVGTTLQKKENGDFKVDLDKNQFE